MIQEVTIGKDIVVLDSDKSYTGTDNLENEEKLVRKALGLPITKSLVYYPDKRSANSIVHINEYKLIEMYDTTERWYTVEITLVDGAKVRIHSGYLAEMQKPSFIADMAKQME